MAHNNKNKKLPKNVWFADGLNFGCTGCGKCCTGSPGFVWLTEEEVSVISDYLAIPREQFLKEYTRKHFGRLALIEKGSDYDCVFLEDKKKCTIYPVRPQQCRTYPFWHGVLATPESWRNEKNHCEGIEREGSKRYSLADIKISGEL